MRAAAKRIGLEIVGWTLLVVGIAALVLPGPGLLMMAGGIVLLSQQYEWAERRVEPIKREALRGAAKSVETWPRIIATATMVLIIAVAGCRLVRRPGRARVVAARRPLVAARRQGDEHLAVRLGRPGASGSWCGATGSSTATPRRSPRSRRRPRPTTTASTSGATDGAAVRRRRRIGSRCGAPPPPRPADRPARRCPRRAVVDAAGRPVRDRAGARARARRGAVAEPAALAPARHLAGRGETVCAPASSSGSRGR